MKWYFASRMRHIEKLQKIAEFLKDKGHTVSSDWIYEDSLKPYTENIEKVHTLSQKVTQSLLENTDIFVLISDPEGTDMFIELGICLAKRTVSDTITIYIVGEHSKRSLMQLHPAINHIANINELFTLQRIKTDQFLDFNFI